MTPATASTPPRAPMQTAAYSVACAPPSTAKPAGACAMYCPSSSRSGPDSLMPMMFGCAASRAKASTGSVTPVKTVTLYSSTGTGDASATAS